MFACVNLNAWMSSSAASTTANVFGTFGAVCWSVQLFPQIWQNYRRQNTEGLQPTMMLLWASAGIPLGIYNIVRSFPVALQIQPQILTLLSLITWAQTQYYPPARNQKPRSVLRCAIVLMTLCCIAGGIEAGIIVGLRTASKHKTEKDLEYYWPVVLMGALSAFLLCAGVGRHYIDIWKERTVRGISFIFVAIDAMGDLTSLISVICWWRAGQGLDILGLVVYGSELVLWMGVMACGVWFNLRPWVKTRMTARAHPDQVNRSGVSPEAELHEQVQHGSSSTPASIRSSSTYASLSSYTSGSVFRTASGRLNSNGGENREGADAVLRDVVRLRNIVQV